MKRFLILAALVIAPAVIAGCTCERKDLQPVCPPVYAQPACPPVAVAQPRPVYRQPVCPLPSNACAIPAAPTYAPAPVGGQITYAQPIQVSGANGAVQYYNPYLQPRYVR